MESPPLHKAVSEFIENSCRVGAKPMPNFNRYVAWSWLSRVDRHELSGSVSELYIEPMLPCVGDVDFMSYNGSILAVPTGFRIPPQRIPPDFEDEIDVFEIRDSDHHGYVFLTGAGKLIKGVFSPRGGESALENCSLIRSETSSWKQGENGMTREVRMTWKVDQVDQVVYLSSLINEDDLRKRRFQTHGPAISRLEPLESRAIRLDMDEVDCIRCPLWPIQATEWQTRPRRHGWPNATTIENVINGGCDVVCVSHRLFSRGDDWNGRQMRLSFSRAETVLLSTWKPVQQIVYHMLRFILRKLEEDKTLEEGLSKNRLLSKYHVKTVMLRASEELPDSCWTTLSAIEICQKVISSLLDCYKENFCESYFIRFCNLFEYEFPEVSLTNDDFKTALALSALRRWLTSFADLSFLTTWFVENYVFECARQCSIDIQAIKHSTVITLTETIWNCVPSDVFREKLSEIVDYRENSLRQRVLLQLWDEMIMIHTAVGYYVKNSSRLLRWRRNIKDANSYIVNYFWAVTEFSLITCFLNVKRCHEIDDVVLGNVALMTSSDELFESYFARTGSAGSLVSRIEVALWLLKRAFRNYLEKNVVRQTYMYIQYMVAFAYLKKADVLSKPNSRQKVLVNSYLSILYYKAGQYSLGKECAMSVVRSGQAGKNRVVIDPCQIPNVDSNIDNVAGLVVLYQFVAASAKNNATDVPLWNVFQAEALAHFINLKCLLETDNNDDDVDEVQAVCRYRQSFLKRKRPAISVNDFLLFYLTVNAVKRDDDGQVCNLFDPDDPSLLRQMLLTCACGHLVMFNTTVAGSYKSVFRTALHDITAMYANYVQEDRNVCLELSQQLVNLLQHEKQMFPVVLSGSVAPIMDDLMTSLHGAYVAKRVLYDAYDDEVDKSDHSYNQRPIVCTQLSMSMYLLTRSKLKLDQPASAIRGVLGDLVTYFKFGDRLENEMEGGFLLLALIYRRAVKYIYEVTKALAVPS